MEGVFSEKTGKGIAVNTRILTTEFKYFVPRTLREALRLIDRNGPNARVIAGGTDLLVQMKLEVISPDCLINIMKIPELNFIKMEKGSLRIGATAKWSEILEFCSRDRKHAALYEAVRSLGKVQVRHMGTIGGNLCSASPAADSAPALLVYNGRVKLVRARGERILPLDKYFKGVNETVKTAQELMTEIRIPSLRNGLGSAFKKLTRVGTDISKISCAVAIVRKGRVCVSCRVAMGAVAPVPMRMRGAEELMDGEKVEASLVEEMGHRISAEIQPITDIRSTAEYRRQVAVVLFKDVFWMAWKRAGGEE